MAFACARPDIGEEMRAEMVGSCARMGEKEGRQGEFHAFPRGRIAEQGMAGWDCCYCRLEGEPNKTTNTSHLTCIGVEGLVKIRETH